MVDDFYNLFKAKNTYLINLLDENGVLVKGGKSQKLGAIHFSRGGERVIHFTYNLLSKNNVYKLYFFESGVKWYMLVLNDIGIENDIVDLMLSFLAKGDNSYKAEVAFFKLQDIGGRKYFDIGNEEYLKYRWDFFIQR